MINLAQYLIFHLSLLQFLVKCVLYCRRYSAFANIYFLSVLNIFFLLIFFLNFQQKLINLWLDVFYLLIIIFCFNVDIAFFFQEIAFCSNICLWACSVKWLNVGQNFWVFTNRRLPSFSEALNSAISSYCEITLNAGSSFRKVCLWMHI